MGFCRRSGGAPSHVEQMNFRRAYAKTRVGGCSCSEVIEWTMAKLVTSEAESGVD